MRQNFPQWNESEQDLSSKGAELTQLANLAFGAEYNEKIRDAQQAIVLAAYQGGGVHSSAVLRSSRNISMAQ